MLKSISIRPVLDGWMVEADFLSGPLMFRSGGRAEDTASRIAGALAENGGWAEITVTTRDGRRTTRFVHPPKAPLSPQASAASVPRRFTDQEPGRTAEHVPGLGDPMHDLKQASRATGMTARFAPGQRTP